MLETNINNSQYVIGGKCIMAIEELTEKTEEVEAERNKKYPLLDIRDSLDVIREISENTITLLKKIYPKYKDLDIWEVTPKITMEFITAIYRVLETKTLTDASETYMEVPDVAKFGIEYGVTANADKDGTLNPRIQLSDAFKYDNQIPENNHLVETPVLTDNLPDEIELVCKSVQNLLKTKHKLFVEEWQDIYIIFILFIRCARQFLIEHKDDEYWGFTINLGNVVDMGIEKYDVEDGVEYCIQLFGPGQKLKQNHSKDDGKTEEASKANA